MFLKHEDFGIWLVLWWAQTICISIILRSGIVGAGMLALSFGMLCAIADLYALKKLGAFAPEHRFELGCFFGIFLLGLLMAGRRLIFSG